MTLAADDRSSGLDEAAPIVADESPRRSARTTTWLRHNLDWICWVVIALVALVILERLRAPTTFFFDEWAFVFDRRSGGLDSLLEGHNGHLSILPVIAYRIGFWLFGLDHYRPFRVGGLLVHVAVATLVFRYVRLRLGQLAGIAAGVLVLDRKSVV